MIGMDAVTGKSLSGIAHLSQSVRDILTTRKGTRVCRREYGSDIPNLVDKGINQSTILDIISEAADSIERWEPRLKVTRVKVDSLSESGKISLTILGILLENGTAITLEGIVI